MAAFYWQKKKKRMINEIKEDMYKHLNETETAK
jgi:hypothetical protein